MWVSSIFHEFNLEKQQTMNNTIVSTSSIFIFIFYFLFLVLLFNAVVWNPWDKKAKALVDFGDDEYKQMLCVDGAAIEKPITLRPGEEWTGRLEISVIPST